MSFSIKLKLPVVKMIIYPFSAMYMIIYSTLKYTAEISEKTVSVNMAIDLPVVYDSLDPQDNYINRRKKHKILIVKLLDKITALTERTPHS